MTGRRQRFPTVDQIAHELRLVHDAHGDELLNAYGWASSYALSPNVGESAKVRAVAADPTGAVAGSKERDITAVIEAAKEITDAVDGLRRARARLERVMRHGERDGYEPERRFPRTASNADLAEAREAQGRRRMAGGNYGEG